MPALGRLRQDCKLRASLGYILKDSIRKKGTQKRSEVYPGFLALFPSACI